MAPRNPATSLSFICSNFTLDLLYQGPKRCLDWTIFTVGPPETTPSEVQVWIVPTTQYAQYWAARRQIPRDQSIFGKRIYLSTQDYDNEAYTETQIRWLLQQAGITFPLRASEIIVDQGQQR